MKLITASIENFKDIEAKEVDVMGRSMVVIGKNGVGKSSFMQAVQSPLNRKLVPLEPIREGEESARIELTLSGEVQGVTKDVAVEMTFNSSNQKGKVKVKDLEGNELANGKKNVEDLLGYISFDPFEFARKGTNADGSVSKKGVEEQVGILKQFLSEDENQELLEVEEAIKEATDKRAYHKRLQKDLDKEVEQTELTQEEIEKYSEKKDEKPILDRIQKLDKDIENYNYVEQKLQERYKLRNDLSKEEADQIEKAVECIDRAAKARARVLGGEVKEDHHQEVNDLVSQAVQYCINETDDEGLNGEISKGEKWLNKYEKPTNEGLMKELEDIREHNRMVDEVHRKQEAFKKARENKDLIKQWDEEVRAAENRKKEIFENSSLPVEGLTFTEDQVLYNGLPFNENQIPTSAIIKVGTRIGMALNPTVRLVTVRDGSLLDEGSMKELVSIVEENDYQLLVERVGDEDDVTVEFAESYLDEGQAKG